MKKWSAVLLVAIFVFVNMAGISVFGASTGDYVLSTDYENGYGVFGLTGTNQTIVDDPDGSGNKVMKLTAGKGTAYKIIRLVGVQRWEADFKFEGPGINAKLLLIDKNKGWNGYNAFEVKNGQCLSTNGKTYYLAPEEWYHITVEFNPYISEMKTYITGSASATSDTSRPDIALEEEGAIRTGTSNTIGRITFVADPDDSAATSCYWDNLQITWPAPQFTSSAVSNGYANVGLTEIPFEVTRGLNADTLKFIRIIKNGGTLEYGTDYTVTCNADDPYALTDKKIILTEPTAEGDTYSVSFEGVKDYVWTSQTTYTADDKIDFSVQSLLKLNGFDGNTALAIDEAGKTISGIVQGEKAQPIIESAIVNADINIELLDESGSVVPVDTNTGVYDGYQLRLSLGAASCTYTFKLTPLQSYNFDAAKSDGDSINGARRENWRQTNTFGEILGTFTFGVTDDNIISKGADGGGVKGTNKALGFYYTNYEKAASGNPYIQCRTHMAITDDVARGVTLNIKPGAPKTAVYAGQSTVWNGAMTNLAWITFDLDGYIYVRDTKICEYDHDKWYNIGFALDVNGYQSQISAYLNGEKVVDKMAIDALPQDIDGFDIVYQAGVDTKAAAGTVINGVSLFDDLCIYPINDVDSKLYNTSPALVSAEYGVSGREGTITVPSGTTAAQVKAAVGGANYEIYTGADDATPATTIDENSRLVVYQPGGYLSTYKFKLSSYYSIMADGQYVSKLQQGENTIKCVAYTDGYFVAAVYNGGRLINVKSVNLAESDSVNVSVAAGDAVKVFRFDSLSSLKPLNKSEVLEQS